MSLSSTSSRLQSVESSCKLSQVPVTRTALDVADLGSDPGGIFTFESYLLFHVSLSD